MAFIRYAATFLLSTIVMSTINDKNNNNKAYALSLRLPSIKDVTNDIDIFDSETKSDQELTTNYVVDEMKIKKEVKMFQKRFGVSFDGIPHNTCMRASDRFCLNDVVKHVINKSYEEANDFSDEAKVLGLRIAEKHCGAKEVLFPESESAIFHEGFDLVEEVIDNDKNHDDKYISRTRIYQDKINYRNREYYNPWRSDIDKHIDRVFGGIWKGAVIVDGECVGDSCGYIMQGAENDNFPTALGASARTSSQMGGVEAKSVENSLCKQLSTKCSKYFQNIKDCKLIIPGKRNLIDKNDFA